MKAMCVIFLALAALAAANEPKEAREFKVLPTYAYAAPYGYSAYPYGFAAAPAAYGATPVKFAAPYTAPQQYFAQSYPAYQYASGYPYTYGYAPSTYSFKFDAKEQAAYLPGSYPYNYGYPYGYTGFPLATKE